MFVAVEIFGALLYAAGIRGTVGGLDLATFMFLGGVAAAVSTYLTYRPRPPTHR